MQGDSCPAVPMIPCERELTGCQSAQNPAAAQRSNITTKFMPLDRTAREVVQWAGAGLCLLWAEPIRTCAQSVCVGSGKRSSL